MSFIYIGRHNPKAKTNEFSHITAEDIIMDDSVVELGDYAFAGNKHIKRVIIQQATKKIGIGCFDGCTELQSVIIYSKQSNIPESFCRGCINLQTIKISSDHQLSVGDLAFRDCLSLHTVKFTDATEINTGYQCFYNCTSMKNICQLNMFKNIGNESFKHCSSLTDLHFTGTSNIGYCAFEHCEGLVSAVISHNMEKIGFGAFKSCYNLRNVDIDCEYIQTMEDNVFCKCYSLENLKINSKIKQFGDCIIYKCKNIKNINCSNFKIQTKLNADMLDNRL